MKDALDSEGMHASKSTANLLARLSIQSNDLEEAIKWGEAANARGPGNYAGAAALMKAYALLGDREQAERWAQHAPRTTGSDQFDLWIAVLALREAAQGPNRDSARAKLLAIWFEHQYEPARQAILELFGETPREVSMGVAPSHGRMYPPGFLQRPSTKDCNNGCP